MPCGGMTWLVYCLNPHSDAAIFGESLRFGATIQNMELVDHGVYTEELKQFFLDYFLKAVINLKFVRAIGSFSAL